MSRSERCHTAEKRKSNTNLNRKSGVLMNENKDFEHEIDLICWQKSRNGKRQNTMSQQNIISPFRPVSETAACRPTIPAQLLL